MLDVSVDKILPVTEVRDSLNKIIDDVDGTDELYVVTKNGKPSAVIAGVHHLEKLTGVDHKELMPDDTADTAETKPTENPAGGFTVPETVSTMTAEPTNPIVPLSGDLETVTPPNSAPTNTIPGVDETSAPSSVSANNGAQASPFSPTTQPIPGTSPAVPPIAPANSPTPAGMTSPISTTTPSSPIVPATDAPVDDADDIFGPADEETPTPPTGTPSGPATSTPSPMTPAGIPTTPPATPSSSSATSTPPPTGTPSGPAPTPPPTTP